MNEIFYISFKNISINKQKTIFNKKTNSTINKILKIYNK